LPDQCKRAVFCVPTDRGNQFLRTEYVSDEFSVVEVNAEHLLELWRNDTDEDCFELAHGNPGIWIKDKNFIGQRNALLLESPNPCRLPLFTVTFGVK